MRLRVKAALAATAIGALVLSACGSNSLSGGDASPAPTTSVSANADLNAKLPDKIRSAGKIVIGTDASYAPNQFTEGGKIVGSEVDLFDAVAKKLGVTAEWQNAPFGTPDPGRDQRASTTWRVSSFTINDERLKQVSWSATSRPAPNGRQRRATRPGWIRTIRAARTIAVQANTVQDQEDLPARQKKCGSNPMKIQKYAGQDTGYRGGGHRQGGRDACRLARDGVRGVEVGWQARAARRCLRLRAVRRGDLEGPDPASPMPSPRRSRR